MNADNTRDNNVDDGRLDSIDNICLRKLWGNHYVATDFHLRFVKSVVT